MIVDFGHAMVPSIGFEAAVSLSWVGDRIKMDKARLERTSAQIVPKF